MVTCWRECTLHISREAGSDGAMTDYIACMQVQGVWMGRGAVGSHNSLVPVVCGTSYKSRVLTRQPWVELLTTNTNSMFHLSLTTTVSRNH